MQQTIIKTPQHIAVFGGTFCPIHRGHLEVALFLQKQLNFGLFLFLPNKAPVLDKEATALYVHRLAMLRLALAPYPNFKIDRREIDRPTPSFMVDTLASLRQELGDGVAISLIIGIDSFQQLHRWHDWQTLFTLCNLIVMDRPGYESSILPNLINARLIQGEIHEIKDPLILATTSRGGFYRCNAGRYDISSTTIRALIQRGDDATPFLPAAVSTYIKEKKLFI